VREEPAFLLGSDDWAFGQFFDPGGEFRRRFAVGDPFAGELAQAPDERAAADAGELLECSVEHARVLFGDAREPRHVPVGELLAAAPARDHLLGVGHRAGI
jgi:hypothetical protein